MEEKERYEIDKSTNYYTNTIVDTKTNAYYGNIEEHIDLLNQQDKQIKELEEENKQLKQQLHDLPKKIVAEIRDVAGDYCEECGNVPDLNTITMEDFDEILDTILEKFGDKNESNND